MISLDLGCGQAKQPDTIGVDMVTLSPVDIAANLWKYPLPFADDSVDNIYLNDVIEHIPNTIPFMEELHRICRDGARVYIRVVYWNTIYMPMDPTHVRAFHENTFDFFGGRKGRNYYTHARFEVVKVVKAWDLFWKKMYVRSGKVAELPLTPSQQCADRSQFRAEGAETDRQRPAIV